MKRLASLVGTSCALLHVATMALAAQAAPAVPSPQPASGGASLEFATREVVDGVHQIALGGDKFYMYVLVGRDKALVVDTQFVAEQKGVTIIDRVRAITDKPLYVVNTHPHGDHIAANAQFGEVHASPAAIAEIRAAAGAGTELGYALTPLKNGEMIDLGDRRVEVIEIPAHNAGSIALLDSASGCLFTGDEIDAGQVIGLHDGNIRKHLANMKLLYEQYYERIRCLAPAHNGAPLSKRYVKYFLDLDAAIIAGTAPVVPTADGPNFPFAINDKMVRYRQDLASIVYTRP